MRSNSSTRLFLIGGDDDYDQLWRLLALFCESSSVNGRLLTLMDGFSDYADWVPSFEQRFRDLGFDDAVTWLPEVRDSSDPNHVARSVRECKVLYVFGGDTSNYVRLYNHPPVVEAIRQHVADGKPYIGMSTGALLAGDQVLLDSHDLPEVHWFEQLHGAVGGLGDRTTRLPGFGILPHVLFDVHFSERARQARLYNALMHVPDTRCAIGIDTGMAVDIQGDVAVARGVGQLHVYEPTTGRPMATFFRDGDVFSLPAAPGRDR